MCIRDRHCEWCRGYFILSGIYGIHVAAGTDGMEGGIVMALLRFESVSFRYPDAETNALEALSFSIEKGEYVVVCGESGCGKTTLLRMTKSELRPVGQGEGTVYYKDKPVQQLNAEQSAFKIGFVQQLSLIHIYSCVDSFSDTNCATPRMVLPSIMTIKSNPPEIR